MKKVASILLLAILLFNWVGYRFYAAWLQNQSNVSLEAQLDLNSFEEADLVSVKIPSGHLSYYTNSKSFERVDGEVEIKGVPYKYVKRRIFNDTVELMCIPNRNAIRLQNARDDFFKLVSDLQHPDQGKKAGSHGITSAKNILDVCAPGEDLRLARPERMLVSAFYFQPDNYPSVYSTAPNQPPETIS